MLASGFKTMTTLRIATLNTWKCEGHYTKRLKVMADQLQEEHLDILCCQEVFRSMDGRNDTASTLAARLGMNYSFAAARPKKRSFQGKNIESLSGMAILTRPGIPILSSYTLPLPEVKEDKDRAAQYLVLRCNGNTLLVVNLHLSHLKGAEDFRREQLDTVLNHPLLENNYTAILLCGDFNEGADYTVRSLENRWEYAVRDGYHFGGGEKDVSSLHRERGKKKQERIDHIFLLEDRSDPLAKLSLSNSRMILDQPDCGIYPSDHCAVALDLGISRIKRSDHAQLSHFVSFVPNIRDRIQHRI